MSVEFTLRIWQAKFAKALREHAGDDFLLVACPAAGKTLGAGAAIANVMAARDANQLIVACPTVVVRDQWVRDLGKLGFRMVSDFQGRLWPEWEHGACVTYAQIGLDPDKFAEACEARGTVAICDEVHHAAESRTWGEALAIAFAKAKLRLHLSGTPFRTDNDMIPFIRYDHAGRCVPDFAYDYATAVRDGVCRPIRFRPHDGRITWSDEGKDHTARFSETVKSDARVRRLRASLDPSQPYLRSVLAAAHNDLMALRKRIPDAAGLVVCDTQAHAMEVDGVLSGITGAMAVLAMSDVPRSHEAILAFAEDTDPWLVSVRMVSEGVDVPRLGVIVWATAATTELLVRQVSGRALRGRADFANLPAIVHMPADPALVRHAEKIEVLAGAVGGRKKGGHTLSHKEYVPVGRKHRFVDPSLFVEWFDRMAGDWSKGGRTGLGTIEMYRRCGWSQEAGSRTMHRWRSEGSFTQWHVAYDLCHMLDLDFEEMFPDAGEEPEVSCGSKTIVRAVAAEPIAGQEPPTIDVITARRRRLRDAGEVIEISTPPLPPSPRDTKAAEEAQGARRGQLFAQLNTYAQLRRMVDPAFLVAAAHWELAAEVGVIRVDASDELIGRALGWVGARLQVLVREHPEAVRELARIHRRLGLAGERSGERNQAYA